MIHQLIKHHKETYSFPNPHSTCGLLNDAFMLIEQAKHQTVNVQNKFPPLTHLPLNNSLKTKQIQNNPRTNLLILKSTLYSELQILLLIEQQNTKQLMCLRTRTFHP